MQTISLFALSGLEWIWANPIKYTREEIPAFDFPNKLYLDWATLSKAKHKIRHEEGTDAPVILFVHGLGNDKDIPYLKRCLRLCLQRGYRCVVFSYWRYDFEESRDYETVLNRIQERYPTAPISAVAWSAGVYPLARYLQKARSSTPLVSVVFQSGCLDFPQAVTDVFSQSNTSYCAFLHLQGLICMHRHVKNDQTLSPHQVEQIYAAMRSETNPMVLYNRFLCILNPVNTNHPLGHEGRIDQQLLALGEVQLACTSGASHYSHRAIDHMDRIEVCTLMRRIRVEPFFC